MIARKVLETTVPVALGLALACLELPSLRGDDRPAGRSNEGGRHASPQRQSSGEGRSYGNGGQNGRTRTDSPPANRTPSNNGGNRGNNAGGGGGDRTYQRNPGGGRMQNPPSQPAGGAQAPAPPTYNPAGRSRIWCIAPLVRYSYFPFGRYTSPGLEKYHPPPERHPHLLSYAILIG